MTGKCIAVDLDGTLAQYDGWKGAGNIGEPVPAMMNQVKAWIADGHEVRIFTARAFEPDAIPNIKKWLQKHGLPDLVVTNEKTPDIDVIYDDKAVAVIPNRGVSVSGFLKHFI